VFSTSSELFLVNYIVRSMWVTKPWVMAQLLRCYSYWQLCDIKTAYNRIIFNNASFTWSGHRGI